MLHYLNNIFKLSYAINVTPTGRVEWMPLEFYKQYLSLTQFDIDCCVSCFKLQSAGKCTFDVVFMV